jgi:hypothetical protein
MVRPNPEREKDIRRLWELGKTIDYIARVTGIPRSSVGYFVTKFNKDVGKRTVSPRERLLSGSGPSKDSPNGESQGRSASAFLKILSGGDVLVRIQSLIGSGDFEKAFYLMASLELFPRIMKMIQPTDDELAALLKDLTSQTGSGSAKQAPPESQNAPPKDSKHLRDLVDSPSKGPETEKEGEFNSTVRVREGEEKWTTMMVANAHIVEAPSSKDPKAKKLNEVSPRLPQKDLANQDSDENKLSKALRAYEEKNKSVVHG